MAILFAALLSTGCGTDKNHSSGPGSSAPVARSGAPAAPSEASSETAGSNPSTNGTALVPLPDCSAEFIGDYNQINTSLREHNQYGDFDRAKEAITGFRLRHGTTACVALIYNEPPKLSTRVNMDAKQKVAEWVAEITRLLAVDSFLNHKINQKNLATVTLEITNAEALNEAIQTKGSGLYFVQDGKMLGAETQLLDHENYCSLWIQLPKHAFSKQGPVHKTFLLFEGKQRLRIDLYHTNAPFPVNGREMQTVLVGRKFSLDSIETFECFQSQDNPRVWTIRDLNYVFRRLGRVVEANTL